MDTIVTNCTKFFVSFFFMLEVSYSPFVFLKVHQYAIFAQIYSPFLPHYGCCFHTSHQAAGVGGLQEKFGPSSICKFILGVWKVGVIGEHHSMTLA